MRKALAAFVLSLALAAPALAQHAHQNGDGTAIEVRGTINSIGPDVVNVSHDPIPEIGWPAMTMDLPVQPDAKIADDVGAGDTVTLMLVKGTDGMYGIGAIVSD